MPLTAGQSILCRASRGVFVDSLIMLPQAPSDASVRRSTELLLGTATKLSEKAKLDGSDYANLPELLSQLSLKYEDTGAFDTGLAVQIEQVFNTMNAQLGWGLTDFDTTNPTFPPRPGGTGSNI